MQVVPGLSGVPALHLAPGTSPSLKDLPVHGSTSPWSTLRVPEIWFRLEEYQVDFDIVRFQR